MGDNMKSKTFKYLRRIFILIMVLSFIIIPVSAEEEATTSIRYCSKSKVDEATLQDTEIVNSHCVCDAGILGDLYSKCQSLYHSYSNTLRETDKNIITVYSYKLSAVKNDDGSDTDETVYHQKMTELLGTVDDVINIAVGIIIFMLAGGFLWNLTQMGIHSSNPQQREIALSRLGDVFTTALFLGSIPMIYKIVVTLLPI